MNTSLFCPSAVVTDVSSRLVKSLGIVSVLSGLLAALPAHAQVPSNEYSYSRSSAFTYLANGLLSSETVEPDLPQSCVTTTYTYDTQGNKITAAKANCAGASGIALVSSQSSSSAFTAQNGRIGDPDAGAIVVIPAGTYAATATNALSHLETRTYDPRFGSLLKLTGPNSLSSKWVVDGYGRKTLETRSDNTRTALYYCWLGKTFYSVAINTSSNTPGCPTPDAAEIPSDAVRFEHSVPQNISGAVMGAYARVYYNRAGQAIRSVTEAFDGPAQPGGAARRIAQDTDYNIYGAVAVVTQPYFFDSGSSGTTGSSSVGLTLNQYDVLGRVNAVYTSDPSTGAAPGYATGGTTGGSLPSVSVGNRGSRQVSVVSVAFSGLVTVTTDDKGRTRKEEKNPDGKVVRVTDASGTTSDTGAQIVHQHDAFGNLLYTKDALGNQIAIKYDIRGRKVSMNDPDAGFMVYCYDAFGRLRAQQSSTQRGSHTPQACPTYSGVGAVVPAARPATWTHMAYDTLDRLTQRVEPEYNTTWTYDSCTKGLGKVCQSSTTNGIVKKYVYDLLGRPFNTRTDFTSGPSFTSAVAYDGNTGRVQSQTYPTGVQIGYQYTAKGFLESVKTNTAATITPLPASVGGTPAANATVVAGTLLWQAKAVNAWGKAELQTFGNGVNNRAVFEPASGRVTNINAGLAATNDVTDHRYVWDSVNQLSQRVDFIGDASGVQVLDTFQYDKLGRLTQYAVSGGSAGAPSSRSVSLGYNALGMLLTKSDVGNYSYPTQGVVNGRPHSVSSVSGSAAAAYAYDLNGNATTANTGKWRAIAYTSFNLPGNTTATAGIDGPSGSPRSVWLYDENHQRARETRTNPSGTRNTWYLHPDNRGGLGFEREVAANGAQSNRHYISAGGSAFAVLVTTGALPTLTAAQTAVSGISTVASVKLEYWHKDHLGSLIATTSHSGAVTARYTYDPFGKRRYNNSTYDAFGNVVADWTTNTNNGTDRGFTGHEHLDDVGLVHMNGRIFDPLIGRFLQADSMVQAPGNLQNYDRYAYCYNNPLTCTDPSGQLSMYLKNPVRLAKWIDPAGNYALTKTAQNKYGYMIGSIAIGVASLYCGPGYAACVAGGTAAWATFAGASDSQAFKSGVIAGATAYAMSAVGDATSTQGYAGDTYGQSVAATTNVPANVAGHALVGCASAAAGGGNCGSGALSGAFGAALSNSGFYSQGNIVVATMQHALAGGIGSVIGGGKFGSGALTGAFGYLFNALMHPMASDNKNPIPVEYGGLSEIRDHLNWLSQAQDGIGFLRNPQMEAEAMMYRRLQAGMSSDYDTAFYHHELAEARMMQKHRGAPLDTQSQREFVMVQQAQAHQRVMEAQRNNQYHLYHPTVVNGPRTGSFFDQYWKKTVPPGQ
jgi:RHS repeat-associated protein